MRCGYSRKRRVSQSESIGLPCLSLGPVPANCRVVVLKRNSHVIPGEAEGPLKCGTRHPSRRGPWTTLRMTPFGSLVFNSVDHVSTDAKHIRAKRLTLPGKETRP